MPQARDEAGNIWEIDAQGNPVGLVQAAGTQQGQVFSLPPDPMESAQNVREEARLDLARDAQAQSNAIAAARLALDRRAEQRTIAAEERERTGQKPVDRDRVSRLNQLVAQINRTQQLYNEGVGQTKGVQSLLDYLPSDTNARFDVAGGQIAQQGLAAFRVPGTGTVSDRDAIMFDRANLPTAATRDVAIEEQLNALRSRVDEERQTLGLPKTPWQNLYLDKGGRTGAAPAGSTQQAGSLPPEMQREYDAWIAQNARNITPDAYVAFRSGLDRKYGFDYNAQREEEDREWAVAAAAAGSGGGTINTQIPAPTQPLSGLDQLRNDAVSNPFGAAAVGALDAGGFGGVSALAGDRVKALGDANPLGMGAGQIVGSIAGTSALGRLGRETIGRAAPGLLGGASRAQLGRDLATDAVYSAGYGANTGNDPLGSAVLGVGGSVVGRGVGRGVGAAVGGVNASPAVQALRQRGIPLTVGQALGGIAKGIEDRLTGVPGVGEMVNARRLEGLREFNLRAMNDALAPIGGMTRKVGEEGISDLTKQISQSYDDATRGVNVPLDRQFNADMRGVARARNTLPSDYATRFDKVRENRIGPIVDAGQMTGDAYQQAMRGLRGSRASAAGAAPGFEQEYRSALSKAMDALTGQMTRGGGQGVVSGLQKSDEAYRLTKTLADAVKKARNGSRSGELQTFTPSQLVDAGTTTAARYPGMRPFAQLADQGQTVLPSSVPDSGTAGRLAVSAALPAVLGGAGGAGLGYTQGDASNGLLQGLAIGGLLAAGGTRGGQKALTAILADRPDAVRRVGGAIRKRKGLFGSATIPLGLEFGE